MKKWISMLLVCVMLFGMLPMYAVAEENVDSEIIASEEQMIIWEEVYANIAAAEPSAMTDEDKEIVQKSGLDQVLLANAVETYETEPNDDYGTANRIYNDYVVGGYLYNGDVDFFKFTLDKAVKVIVQSASYHDDLIFAIGDAEGNAIVASEHLALKDGIYQKAILWTLPAGTYYILVMSTEAPNVQYAIGLSMVNLPASVPMYRMYDPNSGEHFYSGAEAERDFLVSVGWHYEGVGFNFPVEGNPVYRLYDPVYGEHLYTMDASERELLLKAGWNDEGVAFNSAGRSEVPQYRLHNPNAKRGGYHFTGSSVERDFLIGLGWIYQGIGWYSCYE